MKYIDLGLSVLWADCNIGAAAPEEYGDYFSFNTATNFLNVSVPTIDQWQELTDKCKWEWVEQKGVNGYRVTSKTNGNSIFLPAAGYRYGTSLNDVGSGGDYWSSTLYTDDLYCAWGVYFSSSNILRNYYRCPGQSVRPVLEITKNTKFINLIDCLAWKLSLPVYLPYSAKEELESATKKSIQTIITELLNEIDNPLPLEKFTSFLFEKKIFYQYLQFIENSPLKLFSTIPPLFWIIKAIPKFAELSLSEQEKWIGLSNEWKERISVRNIIREYLAKNNISVKHEAAVVEFIFAKLAANDVAYKIK